MFTSKHTQTMYSYARGYWSILDTGDVVFFCPNDGRPIFIEAGRISNEGQVNIRHRRWTAKCDFHENVILADFWTTGGTNK